MLNLPRSRSRLIGASLALLGASTALADIDPNSGIDFVRIGATYGGAGNPAWPGTNPPTPGDRAVGRGRVNYEYNIGKFEVTTAQWVEFFNAAYDRPDAASNPVPFILPPDTWGAVLTAPINGGTQRWRVPAGNEMRAVGDIGWRMAAIYCNWLCNNKGTTRAAFMNGAYDVSTFGTPPNSPFSDQATHNPGARYWIPTWDEWLKAAHFDPNKNGPNQLGWWLYSTTSDTAPISNPPGSLVPGANGQCNAGGWELQYVGSIDRFAIPLGAYANVTSPWGLYDTAGGTSEWTEEVVTLISGTHYRAFEGSWWVDGNVASDSIFSRGGAEFPNVITFDHGLRIASAVPGPWSSSLLVYAGAWSAFGRRRRFPRDTIPASNPPVHVAEL